MALLLRKPAVNLVDRSIIAMGTTYVVRYMRFRNAYPAEDYLNAVGEAVKARMLVLAQHLARDGCLTTDQNGHWLDAPFSEIYEFKPQKHRIFAFRHGTSIYLACGAPKRRAKAQRGDYVRAVSLRNDFFAKERLLTMSAAARKHPSHKRKQ